MDYFENLRKKFITETLLRSATTQGNVVEAARQTAVNQGSQALNSIKNTGQRALSASAQNLSRSAQQLNPLPGLQEGFRANVAPYIRGVGQGLGIRDEDLPGVLKEERLSLPGFRELTSEQKTTLARTKVGEPIRRTYEAVSLYETPEFKKIQAQTKLNRPLTVEEAQKIESEYKRPEILQGLSVLNIPSNLITPKYDEYKLNLLKNRNGISQQEFNDRRLAIQTGVEVNGQKPFITLNEATGTADTDWKFLANDVLDTAFQVALPDPTDFLLPGLGEAAKGIKLDRFNRLVDNLPGINRLITEFEQRTGKVVSEDLKRVLRREIGTKDALKKFLRDQFESGAFKGKKTDDVISFMEKQIKKQKKTEAFNASRVGQFINKIGNTLVDYTLPVERAVKKAIAKGIGVEDINNPYIQLDRVFRSDDIAGQFQRENGLDDVIKSFNNTDYKYFNQYLLAKRNVAENLPDNVSGRVLEEDKQIVAKYENNEQFTKNAEIVREYFRKLADRMYEDGLIDKELRDYLNDKPDYVPFQRVFDELEQEIMSAGATGRPVGSISKQNIVFELKGSERGIVDPLQSAIDYTRKAIKSGEVNKAGQMVGDLVKRGGIPGVIARDADKVLARIALYQDIKEARKLNNAMERLLRTRKNWAKNLEREMTKLSRLGLDTFFKSRSREGFQFVDKNAQAKLQRLITKKEQWLNDLLTETYYDLSPTLDKIAKQTGYDTLTKTQKKEVIRNLTDEQLTTILSEFVELPKYKYDRLFNKSMQKNKAIREAMQDIQDLKDGALLNNVVNGLIRQRPEQLDVIKKQIDRIAPTLNSIIGEIQSLTDNIAANKAFKNQMLDEARMLKDLDTKNKSTISYFRNGIKETIILDKDLVDALKKTNVQNLGFVMELFNSASRLLKLGATTLNLPFAAADFVRNELGVATYYGLRKSLANPLNLLGSIWDMARKGEDYQRYLREGVGGGLLSLGRKEAPETVEKIRAGRNLATRAAYYINPKNFGDLVKVFEDVIQSPSEISRYNTFKNKRAELLAKGVDERTANVQAADFARTALTNFARYGEAGRVIESLVPYFNAGVQGTRAMIKMAKNDPVGFGTRFALYLGGPEYVTTMWNISDPERKKAWDDIPENEKERNFIVILNNEQGGVDRNERGFPFYIAVPKPLQFSSLLNMERKLIEGSYAFDQKTALDIFANVFKTATSVDIPVTQDATRRSLATFVPPLVRGTVETLTNTNLYTGQNIESETFNLNATPSQLRYYEDTSYTMKELSKGLNSIGIELSPLQLQNLVKTQFGGTGEQLINLADYIQYLRGNATEEEVGGRSTLEALKEVFIKARGGETLRKIKEEERKEKQIETVAKIGITQAIDKGDLNQVAQFTPNITEEQFSNLLDSIARDQIGDQLTDKQRFLFNKTDTALEEYGNKNPEEAADVEIAKQAKETAKGMELNFDTGAFVFKEGGAKKSKAPKIGTFKIAKIKTPKAGRKRTPARPSLKVPSLRAKAKKKATVKIKSTGIKPIKVTRKI